LEEETAHVFISSSGHAYGLYKNDGIQSNVSLPLGADHIREETESDEDDEISDDGDSDMSEHNSDTVQMNRARRLLQRRENDDYEEDTATDSMVEEGADEDGS
jgi:hypothetical protein